jgi:hypothetical protein
VSTQIDIDAEPVLSLLYFLVLSLSFFEWQVVMDVEAFRLSIPIPVVAPAKGQQKRRAVGDRFLAGPIPMWWLARAYQLGAAAQAVGLALWHARGMQRGRSGRIKVNAALRRPMGLSKDQARRGVHSLHSDGLVDIHIGGRGRCMEVSIINEVKEPSVPPSEA